MNEQQANALFQQSVSLLQQGQHQEALKILSKLDQAIPSNPGILFFTATGHSIAGNKHKAIQIYERVLRLNPHFIEAYNNIALDFAYLGEHEKAIEYFNKALQIRPDFDECLLNKGCSLNELGMHTEAIFCFEHVNAKKNNLDALVNLSITYLKLGEYAKATDAALLCLRLNPNDHRAYQNLGSISLSEEQPQTALKHFKTAHQLKPNDADAISGIGIAYHQLNNHAEALAHFENALRENPEHVPTWSNLATLYHDQRDFDKAIEFFSRPLENKKRSAIREYDRSLSYLHAGRLEDGWIGYQRRWAECLTATPYLKTHHQRWSGKKTNKPVFIWHEQGIGDQILFGTLLKEANQRATNIVVRLDKRLVAIFQRSLPNIRFISHVDLITDDEFEYHLPIGDLAQLLRPSLQHFELQPLSYLEPNTNQLKQTLNILESGKLIAGLSWGTKGKHSNERNLPIEKTISAIQNLIPTEFVDLQYGDTAKDRTRIFQMLGVEIRHHDQIDSFHDIDGLASLISRCDYVVTCSNSVAHLSGALGKETYLLVPFGRGRHWYWSHIREDGSSMWYPSVNILPQSIAGDWTEPIQELATRLKQRAARN